MDNIVISRDGNDSFTQVSTIFIDEYMPYANDAQLKVYLYLLRSLQDKGCTGICDMADRFNYTEKDVLRALDYWEKAGLLSLSRDPNGTVTYICMQEPRKMAAVPFKNPVNPAREAQTAYALNLPLNGEAIQPQPVLVPPAPFYINPPEKPAKPAKPRKAYSYDEIEALTRNEDFEEVLIFAETYLGKRLTSTDIQTLLYIYDGLGFSSDLIDYLIQYCVEKGKKQLKYIEKVAINWFNEGIKTVAAAKENSSPYEQLVYNVLKQLGRNSNPTKIEADLILSWRRDLGFDDAIIMEACSRAALNADGNRLKYTDGILRSWNNSGVHTVSDIASVEEAHRSNLKPFPTATKGKSGNFSMFQQQNYDMEDLEKLLVTNR